MNKNITLKNEAREALIDNSLFSAKKSHNHHVNNDLYTLESVKSISIPKENRKFITDKCVGIANDAHFPTDFEDVDSHLFGGDYELVFLKYNNEIKGFAVFDLLNIDDKKVLHLHGIIISEHAQHLWQH